MKIPIAPALMFAMLLSACSGDQPDAVKAPQGQGGWLDLAMQTPEFQKACAETLGCETPAQTPGPTEGVWRVRVSRGATGELSIEQVERIELAAEGGIPVGPLYGEHALVGTDKSGNVVDGQLLRFPAFLRIESEEQMPAEPINLSERAVDTLAYIMASPEIVALEVRNRDGTSIDSRDVPVDDNSSVSELLPRLLGISSAMALSRPFSGLSPHCAHIIVLQGEQDHHLAVGSQWEDIQNIATPGPYQLAATSAALNRMTPLLCKSIGRIAFVYVPGYHDVYGAVLSTGAGDTISINVSTMLREEALTAMERPRLILQGTITHEAGHAAETLLTVEGSSNNNILEENYAGNWGFPARTLAAQTVDNVRLEAGMGAEWRRIHNTFVEQGWAKPFGYFGNDGAWSASDIAEGGFMERYGSNYWAEDIASYISSAYNSTVFGAIYLQHGVGHMREDFGCMEMRGHNEKNVPARYAALYTKLHFLLDLGLVRPEDVRDCVGPKLGLYIDEPGFHIWQDSQKKRSFLNQLTARIGTKENGVPIFEMEAAGQAGFSDKMYPAKLKLRLDLGNRFTSFNKVSWPRGVYQLGLTGDNNFNIRLDGAKAGNFDAIDGFVMVAESSGKRIAGSIVLQRVLRLQAPIPVPEKYDPPLVVRFLIEK
jgi:hypothetical protein